MNDLRSAPLRPLAVASLLQVFIFSRCACCALALAPGLAGVGTATGVGAPALRQSLMNALRSSPFLSPACALQSFIFCCCGVSGLAGAGACAASAANAEPAQNVAART